VVIKESKKVIKFSLDIYLGIGSYDGSFIADRLGEED
jgi:hypothetical protein